VIKGAAGVGLRKRINRTKFNANFTSILREPELRIPSLFLVIDIEGGVATDCISECDFPRERYA